MNRIVSITRRPTREVRLVKMESRSATLPPQLRLRGKWLVETAGFRPGSQARVSVLARGMLVIEQLP